MTDSERGEVRVGAHLRAIASLPAVVTLVVPAFILWRAESVRPGGSLPVPWSWVLVLFGCALIVGGLRLMFQSISLFHRSGKGTLAPWNPPSRFVAVGVYRYARNPMISGVWCILLGESALFGSPALLLWFALFALGNAVYMPLIEEPGLERRFGADYALYKQNVPRWIPRLTPWDGPGDSGN